MAATLRILSADDHAEIEHVRQFFRNYAAWHLEALLNYLEVGEGHYFKWNTEFLELFTLSELESLAGEVGLKAKMGAAFKLARAKKKGDFIKSLLAVPGFSYEGTVPTVIQYLRRVVPAAPVAVVEEEALAA